MMTPRTEQVRRAYWFWKAGYMDRKTALGLLRWIRGRQVSNEADGEGAWGWEHMVKGAV